MPDEQPTSLADATGPNAVLAKIIIDLIIRTLQVDLQHRILAQEVAEGLAQAALGQDQGPKFLGPGFHLGPNRRCLRQTERLPGLRRLVARFIFDPIELAKTSDKPNRLPVALERRFIEASPRVRRAPGPPQPRHLVEQRLVSAEVVALKKSRKSLELLGGHFMG